MSVQTQNRKVVHRTRGSRHGPITRLMSPSDLGKQLKPFVFLDLFEADMRALAGSMPVHPHSGIATVTVFTQGDVTFDDPIAGHGTIGYGGLEWARAGIGMWHGKELSAGTSPMVHGFQLWIALPPELERAEPEAQYLGADLMPSIGRPASSSVLTKPGRAQRELHAGLTTCWSRSSPVSGGRMNLLAVTPLRGSRLARARSAAASGCRTVNS
jgi:redox-sensitive bicupin YhaK (pirin superfamily)